MQNTQAPVHIILGSSSTRACVISGNLPLPSQGKGGPDRRLDFWQLFHCTQYLPRFRKLFSLLPSSQPTTNQKCDKQSFPFTIQCVFSNCQAFQFSIFPSRKCFSFICSVVHMDLTAENGFKFSLRFACLGESCSLLSTIWRTQHRASTPCSLEMPILLILPFTPRISFMVKSTMLLIG